MDSRYQKHLTLQNRYDIEEGLNHGYTLTRIAEVVGKDKTTISKEIRKHRIGDKDVIGKTNDCMNCFQCPIQHLCDECDKEHDCRRCRKVDCRKICPKYRSEACKYTSRAPYVCNGCSMIYDGNRQHYFYRAATAYSAYVERLKSSREGISMTRQEPELEYACRKDRTYQDFQDYISAHDDVAVVEMDTVHGAKQRGKVLLTMLFRNSSLMLIFLLADCGQDAVRMVFDMLTEGLGLEEFRKTFPVILTDNGSEFKNPEALEKTDTGAVRSRIFYCDPLASWQKAKLEKNHEYIRRVLPKGKSLDMYVQEDITLLGNHINRTVRKSLNGRTPYELAKLLTGLSQIHSRVSSRRSLRIDKTPYLCHNEAIFIQVGGQYERIIFH